jgi:hypothetical protein
MLINIMPWRFSYVTQRYLTHSWKREKQRKNLVFIKIKGATLLTMMLIKNLKYFQFCKMRTQEKSKKDVNF